VTAARCPHALFSTGRTSGSGISAVPGHELIQDSGEFVQAIQVSLGQLLQYALALAGQADAHHAAVVSVRRPRHQPGVLGPVDELDRAVRPQQQVPGQITHGGRQVSPVSFDGYQQLMLNMGQALSLGLVFAPPLEAAQGNPELQEPLEVLLGQPGR